MGRKMIFLLMGVMGRNTNANVLKEGERNQKGIHNPRQRRPKAPERGRR